MTKEQLYKSIGGVPLTPTELNIKDELFAELKDALFNNTGSYLSRKMEAAFTTLVFVEQKNNQNSEITMKAHMLLQLLLKESLLQYNENTINERVEI